MSENRTTLLLPATDREHWEIVKQAMIKFPMSEEELKEPKCKYCGVREIINGECGNCGEVN